MTKDAARAVAILATAVTLFAGASCTREAPQEQVRAAAVDDSGGSVTASDGRLTVTLPPGALSTREELRVRVALDLPRAGLIGAPYDLSPDGVAFGEPALLAFRIDDPADRARAARGEIVVARLEKEGWRPLEQSWTEDGGQVVLGLTPHFSVYGLVALGPCSANACPARELCFQGECYAACPMTSACDEADPCFNPYRCGAQACRETVCGAGDQCFFGACFSRCDIDAECDALEECVAGRCVSTGPAPDAGPPPEPDAGPPPEPDAGPPPAPDAGPPPAPDAGPEPACVTNDDCAAGEACELDTCLGEDVCVALPTAPGTTFDSTQGYLDGTWRAYIEPACLDVFTELVSTLFFDHASGVTSGILGTYIHEATGDTGNLTGTNFINDSLNTSYLVNIEESDEVFGYNTCVIVSQNVMTCNHTSTLSGTIVDALLLRQ